MDRGGEHGGREERRAGSERVGSRKVRVIRRG